MMDILKHLYKIVPPETSRTRFTLHGIYFNEGKAVACDRHNLVIVKYEYPREYEGKVIGKKGNELEGRYAPYKDVIPVPSKCNLLPGIDRLFEAAIRMKKCDTDFTTLVMGKDCGISIDVLNKIFPFFQNDPSLFYYHERVPAPVFHLVGDEYEAVITSSRLIPHTYIAPELALQLPYKQKKEPV